MQNSPQQLCSPLEVKHSQKWNTVVGQVRTEREREIERESEIEIGKRESAGFREFIKLNNLIK